MIEYEGIVEKIKNGLIEAGTKFSDDKIQAYKDAIDLEESERAKWALDNILENAIIANKEKCPLCDDTGIPHLILEIGPEVVLSGKILAAIKDGIAEGLEKLPGRPMSVMGNDIQRIDQSGGLASLSSAVAAAPLIIKESKENVFKLHILMLGGGPEIRAKTYRVFHRHSVEAVMDEIVEWAVEGVGQLGCSPCTISVGIGRSHFEATALMLMAMVEGRYNKQSGLEQEITRRVNEANIGPLGLQGKTSVLGTFLKIGQQRASGVRIVCMRPSCCFEPRISTVDIGSENE